MLISKQNLQHEVNAWHPQGIEIYQHLHKYPELSFQEIKTAQFIEKQLQKIGIPFKNKIGGYGILGTIEGGKAGKTIALRADMDALPIIENSGIACVSQHNGVMHACGHDAHMTCLLGAAKLLWQHKEELEGRVLILFQPGEERYPGGANLMLQDGLFADEAPSMIIGQHVLPGMKTGHYGIRPGLCMASADEIYMQVKGAGGHGALPHLLNDTVLAASSIVVGLQQMVSRRVPAHVPAVLSFGKFIANGATNIIPQTVELSGTLRMMNETWRAKAKVLIKESAQHIAKANGCDIDIDIKDGYPCVYNDPALTALGKKHLLNAFGPNAVQDMEIRMTAEDFGFYSQRFPSLFYRFGITGTDNTNAGGLHTPNFKIDLEALKHGVMGLAWLATQLLKDNKN